MYMHHIVLAHCTIFAYWDSLIRKPQVIFVLAHSVESLLSLTSLMFYEVHYELWEVFLNKFFKDFGCTFEGAVEVCLRNR